jgi:hypothetical protein
MGLRETGCGDGRWMELAQDRVLWRALVLAVLNLQLRGVKSVTYHYIPKLYVFFLYTCSWNIQTKVVMHPPPLSLFIMFWRGDSVTCKNVCPSVFLFFASITFLKSAFSASEISHVDWRFPDGEVLCGEECWCHDRRISSFIYRYNCTEYLERHILFQLVLAM